VKLSFPLNPTNPNFKMKKLLLSAIVMLIPVLTVAQQWNFARIFPDTTFFKRANKCVNGLGVRAACNFQGHGIAVDGEGKVWFQPFGPTDSVAVAPLGNTIRGTNVIYVFQGSQQVSFSPIKFVTVGARTDTLGGYFYRDGVGNPAWDTRSGRGLRVDHQGNIIVSQGGDGIMYRLNQATGQGMNRIDTPGTGSNDAKTQPAVDAAGNIYVASVFGGNPVLVYDTDFTPLSAAIVKSAGFSRSLEVSADGNSIYWTGYTTHGVHLYRRADEGAPYDSLGVVIPGVDSESLTRHGNKLWVSAGSTNDTPNRFTPPGSTVALPTKYSVQKYYSFNMADLVPITAANSSNWTNPVYPVAQDSLAWNKTAYRGISDGGAGRPRGLGFGLDGKSAYITNFSQSAWTVQRHNAPTVTANDAEEVPNHLVLEANYPNPFSQNTQIRFALPQAAEVQLVVYDVLGRAVTTLAQGNMAAGAHEVNFDASNLSNGQYFYRLSAGGQTLTRSLMVIR
jgi:Secretion system C-terminal sorting domain